MIKYHERKRWYNVKEIDIIKVEVEIIRSKLFTFLAIASGSWVYAFKVDDTIFTITFLLMGVLAYISHKKKWKIIDFF